MAIPYTAAGEVLREAKQSVRPRIVDNDRGVITANVGGRRVRDWIYANDSERRRMISEARWYVEGWCDGRDFMS